VAPPTLDPGAQAAGLEITSVSHPRIRLEGVRLVPSQGGRTRLDLVFANRSASPVRIAIDYASTYLGSARTRARVAGDSAGTAPDAVFTAVVGTGEVHRHWVEFEPGPGQARDVEVVLVTAAAEGTAVRFPRFSVKLTAR
jgi:hypothetical protein